MFLPRKFKYVIVSDLYPRLCSLAEAHSDLMPYGSKPTSAGFAELRKDRETGNLAVCCFGSSESLKVGSRGEKDAQLILRMFEEPMW